MNRLSSSKSGFDIDEDLDDVVEIVNDGKVKVPIYKDDRPLIEVTLD